MFLVNLIDYGWLQTETLLKLMKKKKRTVYLVIAKFIFIMVKSPAF